jgi:membrane-associated PAP2 superfamily phosphatase
MAEPSGPLQYQLQMLKTEIKVVNATIRQMDDISKSLKEWAITVWTASLGGALITPKLIPYAFATAAIPLLFWLVDSYHHVIQRRFIWRSHRIMDFLNDERLHQSFEQGRLIDFAVMDVASRRERDNDIERFASWPRVLMFKTMSLMYVGLAAISLVVWAMLGLR